MQKVNLCMCVRAGSANLSAAAASGGESKIHRVPSSNGYQSRGTKVKK